MKNNYFLALFLFVFMASNVMHSQTTHNWPNLDDISALENLIETLVPGDTVILADGVYSTDERIQISPLAAGTAALPITFRAATPGGVVFTGGLQMSIGGDFVVIDGFHWLGGYGSSTVIEFRDGTNYANNSTMQNCVMDGLALSPEDIANGLPDPLDPSDNGSIAKHNWIKLYGTYNTVINCSFMNKESAGNMVLVELAYNFSDDPCAIVGHTISNNYFYKFEKIDSSLSNAGDSETVRIGTSSYQMVNSSCIVSNNYFVEADGENEIITNKSKNNIYTNNTFRRSRGSLVLRHGTNATVDGNYFLGENTDGTGGIRIVDSDHNITNNYIQDCITVVDQAIWNNGITFLGGSSSSTALCTSTNDSSSYQRVENINLSNNTIVNTNAPLFYNEDKGSTDPTGMVTNNLIYFTSGNSNLTDVISGDSATAFNGLGTALTYSGNVYTGTNLGATTTGFSEESGITAAADGEIFTFSGTGSAGKGADMGAYEPTTDDMVGYGIGACFLNYLGNSITDGDCTIVVPESLTVSSLSTLPPEAGSYDVSVYSNVSWTVASDNPSWISVNPGLGDGNATVSVSVTQNTDVSERTGSVTFTQDPGGDDIVRVLNVTQEGVDLTELYTLINTGLAGDPVIVDSFSKEQVDLGASPPKTNYATNTLDKDFGTHWTADDNETDGEWVIFDLGDEYDLDLIQIATDDKSDPYGLQVWLSTTGTDPSDFTQVLPTTPGEMLITTTVGVDDEFDQYELTANARYVKLIGFGRFNSGGTKVSDWNNITEIEFYGELTLSIDEFENYGFILYPNPVNDTLNLKVKNNSTINSYEIYSIDGRLIAADTIENLNTKATINMSNFANGTYIFNLLDTYGNRISKKILISN